MRQIEAMLTGIGLGVIGMYILDPEVGRRRRALVRDQMIRLQRKTREAAGTTARDLKNRTLGFIAEGRSYFGAGEVPDEVLAERIRAKLGFLVRHPSAIEVQVTGHSAILRGPVLADEAGQLIDGVRAVRGVHGVENQLDIHADPQDEPALQGDVPKPTGERADIWQHHWSPSTRFLVGLGGVALLLSAPRCHKTLGTAAALGGLGALAYSFMDGNQSDNRSGAVSEDVISGWS